MTTLADALNLAFPAASTGFAMTGVAVYSPSDPANATGLAGATIAIDPASGVGPLYETPDAGARAGSFGDGDVELGRGVLRWHRAW
jgi:hypothetical protein